VYGSDYWKRVFNIQALVDTGAVSPKDVDLFQYADTPEEAFEILKQGLTENYLIPEAAGGRHPEISTDPELLPGVSIEEILPPDVARTRR
jgi:hypothetical protein